MKGNKSSVTGEHAVAASTKGNSCMVGSEMTCAILILTLAICLEVTGTMCMKLSDGYKKIIPSIFVFVLYIAAFAMVPFILKTIPLSITYAVWAGCGTVMVSILSIIFFKDRVTVGKVLSIFGVAISLACLNYFENQAALDDKGSVVKPGTNASGVLTTD